MDHRAHLETLEWRKLFRPARKPHHISSVASCVAQFLHLLGYLGPSGFSTLKRNIRLNYKKS
jgi:hypothetical protein